METRSSSTRERLAAAVTARDQRGALAAARRLWLEQRDLGTAAAILSAHERVTFEAVTTSNVAFLRSYTVEPAVAMLRASALLAGTDITSSLGGFNSYAQEMLDPSSTLYAEKRDLIILAIDIRDLLPLLATNFAQVSFDQIKEERDAAIALLERLIAAARERTAAPLIVHNFALPSQPSLGLLDAQRLEGQRQAVHALNESLLRLARSQRDVYVLDYDGLVSRHGTANWFDARKWVTARLPIAAGALNALADEWLRFVHPLAGHIAKVAVVDLDNTLWGGVVGEEGVERVQIGDAHPGAAHLEVQRALLDLRARGILLAICSKNNENDALEVFRRRSEMLLRIHHFSATRINWNDKVTGLREIAAQLNVGTNALAFIDDNDAERELVRIEAPEIAVVDLPGDVYGFADAIRSAPFFERLVITDEDRNRSASYAALSQQEASRGEAVDLESFLRSLEMVARVEGVSEHSLDRAAQLTQKTNQFNVTTKRYGAEEIQRLASEGVALTVNVRDRLANHGIVGLAMATLRGDECEIDTFLLSCRVIGRGVETALLSDLVSAARAKGARRIVGRFRRTEKNAPAASLFQSHGFEPLEANGEESLWLLHSDRKIEYPDFIVSEANERG